MRSPITSVLSHSVFVAFTSYLFTLLQGGCEKRRYNNTFTGLFHDLPEVLTRDIISPVKNSVEGLGDLIKECEKEQMQAIVYPLLPENLQNEIRLYTETEFNDYIFDNGQMKASSTDEINSLYNDDKFDPRDGCLVKAADELSALIEADIAIKNGSIHDEFEFAKSKLKKKYIKIDKIGTLDVGELFNSF
jgi:putative hydrolase of HD superfamily